MEFYCHPFNDSSIFSEIVRGGGGGYLNLPNVGVSKAFFSNLNNVNLNFAGGWTF